MTSNKTTSNTTTSNTTLCLDKKEKTRIIIGNKISTLDEFDDLLNKDEHIKNKMKEIEKKLDENY